MSYNLFESKESPEEFDIFRVNFIYQEDKLEQSPRFKNRPGLIVTVGFFGGKYHEVAMITSKNTGSNDYEIIDWKQAGLSEKCYIRFLRKELVEASKITANEYVGRLTDKDIQRIKSMRLNK